MEISPPGDINPQFPLPLSYHLYLVFHAEAPVAKKEAGPNTEISATGSNYFRGFACRPTDFHGGFKDHKNQPKVLQGTTNLPAKPCRVVVTRRHVQTCNAERGARACLPGETHAAAGEAHGVRASTGRKQSLLIPNLRTPWAQPFVTFLPSLGGGGGARSPWEQRGKARSGVSVLLLPVPVCVTWANGFLSLRLTLCKRRSLYLQKGFTIFKGKTLNHYSHIWTSSRLCPSHLPGSPKFLREFVWRGVREQVVFLYSPYSPQSLMRHTCLLIIGAPDWGLGLWCQLQQYSVPRCYCKCGLLALPSFQSLPLRIPAEADTPLAVLRWDATASGSRTNTAPTNLTRVGVFFLPFSSTPSTSITALIAMY